MRFTVGLGDNTTIMSVLDLFINSNDTILYTKGRIRDANEVFYANKNKNDQKRAKNDDFCIILSETPYTAAILT